MYLIFFLLFAAMVFCGAVMFFDSGVGFGMSFLLSTIVTIIFILFVLFFFANDKK